MSLRTTTPLPIRIAQTVGISSSLILSGAVLGLSVFSVPRILECPTPLMLQQWKKMFESGKAKNPALAVLSAGVYFWLAYISKLPGPSYTTLLEGKSARYLSAGVLVMGIVPYTMAMMMDTNRKLLEKAEETKEYGVLDEVIETKGEGESAHQLIDRWGVLNFGRGCLLVVGGGLGIWTALG